MLTASWISLAIIIIGVPAGIAARRPRIFIDHIYQPALIVTVIALAVVGIGDIGLQLGMHIMAPPYGEPRYDEAREKMQDYNLAGFIVSGILVALFVYLRALRWYALKIMDDDERTAATRRRQPKK